MTEGKTAARHCFVIGPIGDDDSPERVHADWLLEEIIEPVLSSLPDFLVERADKLAQPGLIDAQVINKLLNADLVIADLSGLNPNAFYEIGIRHMAQRPIIHMHQAGEKIPFDVSLYRSIKFSRVRPRDLRAARQDLSRMIEAVLAPGHEVENPVTNARGRVALEQHATSEQKIVFEQLRAVQERLGKIESQVRVAAPATGDTFLDASSTSNGPEGSSKYISFYSAGDWVSHPKFGLGQVQLVDGVKLTVAFEQFGQKRVVDSFVKPATAS